MRFENRGSRPSKTARGTPANRVGEAGLAPPGVTLSLTKHALRESFVIGRTPLQHHYFTANGHQIEAERPAPTLSEAPFRTHLRFAKLSLRKRWHTLSCEACPKLKLRDEVGSC